MTYGKNVWVDNKKWQPAKRSHRIREIKTSEPEFAEDQTIHSLTESKQAGWPDSSTLQHQWRDGEEQKGGGLADISGNRLDNRHKH